MTKLVEQFIAEQFLAKQTEVKNRKRNWLNLLSNYLLSKNYNQPIRVLQVHSHHVSPLQPEEQSFIRMCL